MLRAKRILGVCPKFAASVANATTVKIRKTPRRKLITDLRGTVFQ